MIRHRIIPLLLLWCATIGVAQLRAQTPAQAATTTAVAIVVHPSTDIDNLSFDELRRIFRGERQFWPDGSRVTLLVRAPVTQERKLVLQKIYRMSEDAFRQYWIAKMFRAEVAAGPKIVYSSEMARELVTAIPGAIGFMPAGSATAGVKVIKIDNRLPNDPKYPLR
jgi:ABC-type phosphate transport system substrate-binding protein